MPFTPFHFGPGLALKGVLGRRLSFSAFVAANVAIDVEPAYYLLTDNPPLHRLAHTWGGALLLALALFAGWWLLRMLLRRLLPGRQRRWLTALRQSHWLPVLAGLLLGALSHIALDSVMHADMRPFEPFATANPWWGLLSLAQLQWACIMAAIAGVPLVYLRN